MNNAKKSIKKAAAPVKKAPKQINSKLWFIVSVALSVILIAAIMFDQLYKRPIITIDGDKYYLEDLNYYFYEVESQYDYMSQLFGTSYWDMSYDSSGATVRDIALQEAVNTALSNEILYREAISSGYSITEEDTTKATENVDTLFEGRLTEAIIKKNGFTKESLNDLLVKMEVVNRYREDKIESFDIDDEAIKATVDYEEFRQYDIETVFISTKTKDEDGNSIAMTEEEKATAYSKISDIYATAQSSEDWSTLLSEDEKELIYSDTNFTANSSNFSEDFTAIIKGLSNDQISEIYEEENGYYFVRMINNNSTEAYDEEVENAIESEETSVFQEYYNKAIENYNYKVHKSGLRTLTMGNITLAK